MIEVKAPPPPPAACTLGAARVATGAALFAVTNAAATQLFRRNGASVVSLYVIRTPILFVTNAVVVLLQQGRTPAVDVLLLRTGSSVATQLALARSVIKTIAQILVSIAFVFLTYADAFCVFKGVATLGTVLVARCVLGSGEALSAAELACGVLTLAGILMVSQPPALFGSVLPPPPPPPPPVDATGGALDLAASSWAPNHVVAGLLLAALSGTLQSASSVLMRVLSQDGGPRAQHASPAMLFSFLTLVYCLGFGGLHVASRGLGLSDAPGWTWGAFLWPAEPMDWLLIGLNCACTLTAHLLTAAGYGTTRAGMVAFLSLTELPWVYVIDVLVMREPTSTLAALGCVVVFAGALGVALQPQAGSA